METIRLSCYLQENNFELKKVNLVWHPVDYAEGDKYVKKRAFFATIYAIDKSTGNEEVGVLSPRFATEDRMVFFGYECDDLILYPDSSRFPGMLLWNYAIYGDTVAVCGDIQYQILEPHMNNRLNRLFVFQNKYNL